jgi:ubiquinone/menaquinone biosynthesis C-methylase UbiE
VTHQHGYRRVPDVDRRKWQDPEAILADMGLKPGIVFMDIGCGEGFFAIPAARLVGESGRVYALDSRSEAIAKVEYKAAREGLRNLEAAVGKAEETVLCRSCADIVFFGIVLHDFADPGRVLANAREMLKPGGRLVNLDWKKEHMGWGPPFHIRFTQEEAVQLIKTAGFAVGTIKEAGQYHYLIIAKPLKT